MRDIPRGRDVYHPVFVVVLGGFCSGLVSSEVISERDASCPMHPRVDGVRSYAGFLYLHMLIKCFLVAGMLGRGWTSSVIRDLGSGVRVVPRARFAHFLTLGKPVSGVRRTRILTAPVE